MVLLCRIYHHRFWGYCGGNGCGRILTVILVLYGIFVIALIPGVVVNYFVEFNKIRYNESLLMFMDRLEHLDTLSKEELREISQDIRNFRGK